jgi:hypothetical protein
LLENKNKPQNQDRHQIQWTTKTEVKFPENPQNPRAYNDQGDTKVQLNKIVKKETKKIKRAKTKI